MLAPTQSAILLSNAHCAGVGGGLSPEAQANWTGPSMYTIQTYLESLIRRPAAGVVQQLVAKGHDEASALVTFFSSSSRCSSFPFSFLLPSTITIEQSNTRVMVLRCRQWRAGCRLATCRCGANTVPRSSLPMQSVQVSDIVTMLPACDKTCWVGVSMHCDDYGVARGLPVRSTAVLSVVVVAMMVHW